MSLRKMKEMKRGCFLVTTLLLLLGCVPWHVTADSENGEEDQDIPGAALPPLKLGNSICALKADGGACKAIYTRYYFNIQTRQCEMFEYGGCHGNENNFITLEECQEMCVVSEFLVKKTRGRFKKEKPDFCFMEQDPGICRGYFSRYFYNKESQQCEKFKYGGCLGNQNNFKALEECQIACQDNSNSLQLDHRDEHPIMMNNSSLVAKPSEFPRLFEPPPLPSLCMTPADRGLCKANEKRFFYDHSTGKCHPFSYSGCGGNENNFTSKNSCLRTCKKDFSKKQGRRGLMKIKRKRKKQPLKLREDEIIIERI
ncbi:tissue factor pathway inhibitor isoform X1 [Dermochelys coriacea]|uniref:tissue factor pathway inhibitor isoform X1 n=2 Tax=Dermochelys coriacea TaxID=27794 RepID=UPI001CA88F63|nr:tissue factor pathway inhibitor isoform X1 [Dermochelys coriacea]